MGLCGERRKIPELKHVVSTWKTDLVLLMYRSPPVSCSRKWTVVSVFTASGVFSTRTQLQSQHHVARQNKKFWVLPTDDSCRKRRTSFLFPSVRTVKWFHVSFDKMLKQIFSYPFFSESKYKCVCFAGRQKGVFELGMSWNIWFLGSHKEIGMVTFCLRASIKLLRWCWILTKVKLQLGKQLQVVVA